MPLFNEPIEQELWNYRIKANQPMSEAQFFARELEAWRCSEARREMLDGARYYSGDHDILRRQRTSIGENGQLVAVDNLPNNKIVDNQYAKHADVKKNYIVGKPITFAGKNETYLDALKKVLGARFMRTIKNAVLESFNSGISWLYPYYDRTGQLAFKLFPGYEILPFWADAEHTVLDAAIRLYQVEVYYASKKKIIEKADIFKPDGVATYIFENGTLTPDSTKQSYITLTDASGNTEGYNWAHFPLIPIKYNAQEIPLIRRCRSLQDAINLIESDFVNNMQEDARNTVLILKNYDGQDLGEFRKNISTYGAVKVRTVEGVDGGVDSLEITVNSENYKTVLDLLKKSLIENLRSYDAKDDRMSNSPNKMNIQSMYSDIDLDANDTEVELQAAFEEILWFVNTYLASKGQAVDAAENVEVIFNRDVLINETEAISNCAASVGIISDDTIVSMHPWVKDPAAELKKLEKQKEEADPYRAAFEMARNNQNADDGTPMINEE